DFGRLAEIGSKRASVHDMRTKLDVNDRRMMAVDHHLNSQNDELAREIEALRQEEESWNRYPLAGSASAIFSRSAWPAWQVSEAGRHGSITSGSNWRPRRATIA